MEDTQEDLDGGPGEETARVILLEEEDFDDGSWREQVTEVFEDCATDGKTTIFAFGFVPDYQADQERENELVDHVVELAMGAGLSSLNRTGQSGALRNGMGDLWWFSLDGRPKDSELAREKIQDQICVLMGADEEAAAEEAGEQNPFVQILIFREEDIAQVNHRAPDDAPWRLSVRKAAAMAVDENPRACLFVSFGESAVPGEALVALMREMTEAVCAIQGDPEFPVPIDFVPGSETVMFYVCSLDGEEIDVNWAQGAATQAQSLLDELGGNPPEGIDFSPPEMQEAPLPPEEAPDELDEESNPDGAQG
jgi:hypothetical protein